MSTRRPLQTHTYIPITSPLAQLFLLQGAVRDGVDSEAIFGMSADTLQKHFREVLADLEGYYFVKGLT